MDGTDKQETSRNCYYNEATNETICDIEYSDGSKEKKVTKGKSMAAGVSVTTSSTSGKMKKIDYEVLDENSEQKS